MEMGGQHHAPAALPPGKTRYPLYRRLGGLQGRSGRVRIISPLTGIRSPDRPSCSESVYRLSYRSPLLLLCIVEITLLHIIWKMFNEFEKHNMASCLFLGDPTSEDDTSSLNKLKNRYVQLRIMFEAWKVDCRWIVPQFDELVLRVTDCTGVQWWRSRRWYHRIDTDVLLSAGNRIGTTETKRQTCMSLLLPDIGHIQLHSDCGARSPSFHGNATHIGT